MGSLKGLLIFREKFDYFSINFITCIQPSVTGRLLGQAIKRQAKNDVKNSDNNVDDSEPEYDQNNYPEYLSFPMKVWQCSYWDDKFPNKASEHDEVYDQAIQCEPFLNEVLLDLRQNKAIDDKRNKNEHN